MVSRPLVDLPAVVVRMALAPAAPPVGAAGLVVPAARPGAVHWPAAVVPMPSAVPLMLIAVPAAVRVTVPLVPSVLPVGPRVWGR